MGGEWVGSDSTDELGRYDATVEGWSVLPGGPPRGAFYASAPASRVATRAHKHVCKTGTSGQVKFLGAR